MMVYSSTVYAFIFPGRCPYSLYFPEKEPLSTQYTRSLIKYYSSYPWLWFLEFLNSMPLTNQALLIPYVLSQNSCPRTRHYTIPPLGLTGTHCGTGSFELSVGITQHLSVLLLSWHSALSSGNLLIRPGCCCADYYQQVVCPPFYTKMEDAKIFTYTFRRWVRFLLLFWLVLRADQSYRS